jgi:peptidoglycan/LPS O-acetylase OafA/YrhL
MAMGGFGACLFFKQNSFFLRLCFSKITQFIAWLIIGLLIINKYHVASLIDHQIISLVTLVLIVNGIANEKRILSIENKLMTFLGKISFGIYVYHPLLILLISLGFHNMESDASIKAALFYTLVLSSTIVVSYLSYNYFEKKFLQLKTKYTSVAPSSIEPNSHNTNTLERVTI